MQHIHSPALPFEGHVTLWRAVKYLGLALALLIAVLEHSPAFLIFLALAVVLVLALVERTYRLPGKSSLNPSVSVSRLLGDGGCFPGVEPEQEKPASSATSVLDGGSLEHHRS
jgi:hypothetical protein